MSMSTDKVAPELRTLSSALREVGLFEHWRFVGRVPPPEAGRRCRRTRTTAHSKRSAVVSQPSACIHCSPPHGGDHVLRRSPESAQFPGMPCCMHWLNCAEFVPSSYRTQFVAVCTNHTTKMISAALMRIATIDVTSP